MASGSPSSGLSRRLQWKRVYREADLYKAAVRVYTKPLFHWRKALGTSTDGKTLYDFAERGLSRLDAIHRSLQRESFEFRPSIALKYNFNGKRRTLYIQPWDERIVDLALYRVLNQRLHRWFSSNSFAYRDRSHGLDHCQSRIAAVLRSARRAVYVVKRDIRDYFASVDHDILLEKLSRLVEPRDYLFRLLEQRVRFLYHDEAGSHRAALGISFGSAMACVFANIYLTDLDRALESVPAVSYFRYADDILILSCDRDAAIASAETLELGLGALRLCTKASHQADLVVAEMAQVDSRFAFATEFRHLGLLFRANGEVALSRDKCRKIENLFRFAFRRTRRRWRKIDDPNERARSLAAIAAETIEKGVRNVAIIDYYLKHVEDEEQLRLLDRWMAEEVLSLVFGGHKKGHFRRISFANLRAMGLPSLVHRRRMIRSGYIESPFFVWQREKAARAFRGTVARLLRTTRADAAFSPGPEAAAKRSL
ncbi:MAG TPA: reverse transcriptase domain-containing protein [Terriglobales bacterium]|nr:reverse transcriptase domain-containing protein [Terriglobales bacterium]